MEILTLVLLYYFSQNPHFAESVKPLMEQIKDSEQMLTFLKDLSNFSQTFSTFKGQEKACDEPKQTEKKEQPHGKNPQKESPQSPTTGIADDFIQSILDSYLTKFSNN